MNRLRLLGALLVAVLWAVALFTIAAPAYAYDGTAAPRRAGLCDYSHETADQGRSSLRRPVRCDGSTYDDRSNVAPASSRLDANRLAPRAIGAARQVDAAWGPARQYAHGSGLMTAIEHINYRHAFNSGFDDVSRFAQGTGARQIQGYVDDALRYGNVSQGGASIRYDLGRVIGYDQAGNPVTGIQVWVRDGYIRTAYPVAP